MLVIENRCQHFVSIVDSKRNKMENSGTVGVAGKHCPWKLALIIIHGPVFIVTMAINYMSTPAFPQSGKFSPNLSEIQYIYSFVYLP